MAITDDERLRQAVELESTAIMELAAILRNDASYEHDLSAIERAEAAARDAVAVAGGVDRGAARRADVVQVTTKRFNLKQKGDTP